MVYRDSRSEILTKLAELEAVLDGFRPRLEALEMAVSRLEVNVAVLPARVALGGVEPREVAGELADRRMAEQVGHIELRVEAIESRLGLAEPPKRSSDDLRALVADEAELGGKSGR
ncbi:MAG: hypothetical protein U0263_28580 [Polyangiaceae bacterium]